MVRRSSCRDESRRERPAGTQYTGVIGRDGTKTSPEALTTKRVPRPPPDPGEREIGCATVRPALPPATSILQRRGDNDSFPCGLSTVVERSLWIRMAVAFSEPEAQQAWAHVMSRARADLPDATVVMWFAEVRPISLTDDALEFAVPSPMIKERLHHHHLHLIEEAAADAVGRPLKIEIEVDDSLARPGGNLVGARIPRRRCAPATLVSRVVRRDRGSARPRLAPLVAQSATRGAGAPVPQLHLRRVRPRPQQPVRARGRHGRRRGSALHRLQPAVHLRGRGSGQDAPADRGGPSHVPPRPGICASSTSPPSSS